MDDNDSTWSLGGLAVFAAFVVAAGAYLTVRVTELAAAGRLGAPWPAAVLAAELLGASSVGLYALCLARRLPASLTAVARSGAGRVPPGTHVHVLVPCYTEALTIVAETVWAAAEADLPPGATSTVWLLDDGADPAKKEWVAGLACPRIRYVAGRARPAGEVNGKAANLNAALASIYPRGVGAKPPGPHEAVAVFDADQVCDRAFFKKTLPLLFEEGGVDGRGAPPSPSSPPSSSSARVGLVLTPQRYANVDERADIFNHSNRHFWEAMIPGLTSWGMVVCTGTNLVLRSNALMGVGGFPADTVTEDYLLGMNLKMAGREARYLPEYLAVGEAPEDGSFSASGRAGARATCRPSSPGALPPAPGAAVPAATPALLVGRVGLRRGGRHDARAGRGARRRPRVRRGVPRFALRHHPAPRLRLRPLLRGRARRRLLVRRARPAARSLVWRRRDQAALVDVREGALANTALWALGLKRASRFKSTAKAGLGPSPPAGWRRRAVRLACPRCQRGGGARALGARCPLLPPALRRVVARHLGAPPPGGHLRGRGGRGHRPHRVRRGGLGRPGRPHRLGRLQRGPPAPPGALRLGRAGASLRGGVQRCHARCPRGCWRAPPSRGWLFLPPHIRGDAFGLGDRYTGGGGGLYRRPGPRPPFLRTPSCRPWARTRRSRRRAAAPVGPP